MKTISKQRKYRTYIIYCPTAEMVADMFTKGLSRELFCKLRKMAGIVEPP